MYIILPELEKLKSELTVVCMVQGVLINSARTASIQNYTLKDSFNSVKTFTEANLIQTRHC